MDRESGRIYIEECFYVMCYVFPTFFCQVLVIRLVHDWKDIFVSHM